MNKATNKPDFEKMGDQPQPGLASEFIDFLAHNKKWWLLPILLFVGLIGVLALSAGSGAAPFIYTLF